MKQWKCSPRMQDRKARNIMVLMRHSEPVDLCSSPFIFPDIFQWDCANAPSPTSLVKTWKMVTGRVKMLVPTREESTSNLEDPEGAAGHCLTAKDVQGWRMPWVTALPKSQKRDVMEEPDVNSRAAAPDVWSSSALKVSLALGPEKEVGGEEGKRERIEGGEDNKYVFF